MQRAGRRIGDDLGGDRAGIGQQHRRLVERKRRTGGHVRHAGIVRAQAGHVPGASGMGQHDRAVQDRVPRRTVRQTFDASVHRQCNLHAVAVAPLAAHRDVGGRRRRDRHRLAVDLDGEGPRRHPAGMPEVEREALRPTELQREPGAFLVGKRGVLPQGETERSILQLGSDEEVDVDPVSSPRVDELAVPAGILHAGADAAPEPLVRHRVDPVVARSNRREVDVARVLGVDRGEDVVVERALVVVGVGGARSAGEQLLGEPQHVVGVAGLGALPMGQHAAGNRADR